jgi:uncharacterized protein (TIGR02270 family)
MLDVLEEHFEELDFLWEQRERVLFAPDWMIDQLGELEARAEAHLDGLVIGAGHSVAIAKPYLVAEETGVATAAAFTLLAMDSAPLALDVVDSLRMGPPAAREGIKLALFHSDVRNVVDAIYELSMGRDINLRALATEVLAFHRLRPPPEVERLLEHQDVGVRRRATWATGRFGSMTSAAFERGLRDEDRTLRKWTLEAAAYCGLPELLPLCRGMTRGPDASHEVLAFLGVVGDRQDLTTLKAALSDRRLAAGAIAGMASLGNVAAVPLLLEAMGDPDLATPAAEAFTRITGASVARESAGPPVEGSEHDAEDEFAATVLPLDVSATRTTWDRIRPRFQDGEARFQMGMDLSTVEFPVPVLSLLPLQARRDAYVGARSRNPRAVPDLELESRVACQQAVLSKRSK